jgi:hypothetical protein
MFVSAASFVSIGTLKVLFSIHSKKGTVYIVCMAIVDLNQAKHVSSNSDSPGATVEMGSEEGKQRPGFSQPPAFTDLALRWLRLMFPLTWDTYGDRDLSGELSRLSSYPAGICNYLIRAVAALFRELLGFALLFLRMAVTDHLHREFFS